LLKRKPLQGAVPSERGAAVAWGFEVGLGEGNNCRGETNEEGWGGQ